MASSSTTAGARAAELREVLNRALVAYHVEDEPIMEDAAYDALFDELVALEAEVKQAFATASVGARS